MQETETIHTQEGVITPLDKTRSRPLAGVTSYLIEGITPPGPKRNRARKLPPRQATFAILGPKIDPDSTYMVFHPENISLDAIHALERFLKKLGKSFMPQTRFYLFPWGHTFVDISPFNVEKAASLLKEEVKTPRAMTRVDIPKKIELVKRPRASQ